MRRIVRSRTYVRQLQEFLDFGANRFGPVLAHEKLAVLDTTLQNHLAHFPATGIPDKRLGLLSYAIGKTPFLVLYDFDDDELRLHFIVHQRSDRSYIDPKSVDW